MKRVACSLSCDFRQRKVRLSQSLAALQGLGVFVEMQIVWVEFAKRLQCRDVVDDQPLLAEGD